MWTFFFELEFAYALKLAHGFERMPHLNRSFKTKLNFRLVLYRSTSTCIRFPSFSLSIFMTS